MFTNIHNLLRQAYKGDKTLHYLIAGDSLRGGNTVTGLFGYYQLLMHQLNIIPFLNAEAANTSLKWQTNTANSTIGKMQYALDKSKGTDGEDTILEFSFGVNDINVLTYQQTKDQLQTAIETFQALKPAAHVLLCVPSVTVGGTKANDLRQMYYELSDEMLLPLVDGHAATMNVAPDPLSNPSTGNAYYQEHTHINDNGGRRLLNHILQNLLPSDIGWSLRLPEYNTIDAEPSITNMAVVETGNWSYLGVSQPNSNWRRLQEVTVVPRSIIKLAHKGGRLDIMWKDTNNVTTREWLQKLAPNQTERYLIVPDNTISIKVNIDSVNGAAYDALNDTPKLHTAIPLTSYSMPIEKINLGLSVKFHKQ